MEYALHHDGNSGRIGLGSYRIEYGSCQKVLLLQLALNALWSYLFFGLKNPMLALLEIVILWLMIYETYVQFGKINKIAGYLFIPYLLW
jgi:tryptophan-rich sensory protein